MHADVPAPKCSKYESVGTVGSACRRRDALYTVRFREHRPMFRDISFRRPHNVGPRDNVHLHHILRTYTLMPNASILVTVNSVDAKSKIKKIFTADSHNRSKTSVESLRMVSDDVSERDL